MSSRDNKGWWRWTGDIVYRLITQRSKPKLIALGAAVGTFVSVLPIVPLQSVTALAINYLVGGNRIAALGFIWLSNPLFFYLDYRIGTVVLQAIPWLSGPAQLNIAWHTLTLTHIREALVACLVGGVVFGVTLGALVFIGTYWAAVAAQGDKRQRVRAR